mgnify:CR=1 FL=1
MTNRVVLSQLNAAASKQGLYVAAYSPGDGKTRYRFFESQVISRYPDQDYFGPANGLHTVIGAKAAWDYLGVEPKRKR